MVRGQHRGTDAVFVDRSGRRRRWLNVLGVALGGVLVAGLGLLAATLAMGHPVPLPNWPDSGVQVGQNPRPEGTAPPTTGPNRYVTRTPSPPVRTSSTGGIPTDQPGRGDEHRRSAKPTAPPGKSG